MELKRLKERNCVEAKFDEKEREAIRAAFRDKINRYIKEKQSKDEPVDINSISDMELALATMDGNTTFTEEEVTQVVLTLNEFVQSTEETVAEIVRPFYEHYLWSNALSVERLRLERIASGLIQEFAGDSIQAGFDFTVDEEVIPHFNAQTEQPDKTQG